MLSAQECDTKKSMILASVIEGNNRLNQCRNMDYSQNTDCKLVDETSSHALFCLDFEVLLESNQNIRKHRPLSDICFHSTSQTRDCVVFAGSGKYVSLELASKGGTTSIDGKWSIHTLSSKKLDFIILDYSINDFQSVMDHLGELVYQILNLCEFT